MTEHHSEEEVGSACEKTAATSRMALDWIADEANERKISLEQNVLQRRFRRDLISAERLAKSVSRPTCVGIFGPSQAGKSYLVSALARKEGQRLIATFAGDEPEVDFVTQINPAGGKEATGLVTRFTLTSEPSPPGLPVCLRLLSQSDVVKIVANSYYNDGKEEDETPLEAEEINRHIEKFARNAGAQAVDGMREQDVWDIQEYFKSAWQALSHPSRVLERFWPTFAELAPRLPLEQRAELFSVLWGRHDEFTRLFLKLAKALKALNFEDSAFTSLDALRPSATGLVNVETLKGLDAEGGDPIRVATLSGAATSLPRAVVAAIAAELRIVCRDKSWPFLDHTDILDFPGYRSRQRTNLQRYFSESKEAIRELFLRGKVDYLFQRYTDDLELTCLVLCLNAAPLEVVSLPEALEKWIEVTHGMTAESRASRPTLLFLALTWFDVHLVDKASDEANDDSVRFQARLDSSLLQHFARSATSWPKKWKPGQQFNNCYWIRNPNVEARHVFEYDDKREARIIPERESRVAELREGHNSAPNVQAHFKDPDRAWAEAMKLNDGGVSYLAEGLGEVCGPELKLDQLFGRLQDLRQQMRGQLEKYYVPEDLEKRLQERRAVAEHVVKDLQASEETDSFGSLLSGLCVHEAELYTALLDELFRPARKDGAKSANPSKATDRCGQLARKAIQYWTEAMDQRASDPSFALQVSISNDNMHEITTELSAAARLWDLASVIANQLRPLTAPTDTPEVLARRGAVIAERFINAFVCSFEDDLGGKQLKGNGHGAIFRKLPAAYDASGIEYEPKSFKEEYVNDWITGFRMVVDQNASTKDGMVEDPIQNAKLGRILTDLGSTSA